MKSISTVRVSILSLLALAACSGDGEPPEPTTGGASSLVPGGAGTSSGGGSPTAGNGANISPPTAVAGSGGAGGGSALGVGGNMGADVGGAGGSNGGNTAADGSGAGGSNGGMGGTQGPTGSDTVNVGGAGGDVTGVGGATGMGDAGATGGMPGSDPSEAAWGRVENPGAGCSVPALPAVNSLTADAKLPDPFTKMDGSRITDKSEWRCRREEILQQAYAFIYGEKPVPAEGSVVGSVSNSRISVQVNNGGTSASFEVAVNMNGATAPAPAIIVYGGFGGPPVPNGVATITFNAIESTGGSGPKNGPFYSLYGANHPAGYLVAQAWQVSRIIDVLEQDPSIIDPYRIGVTGCSRLGKGAFVAGALDNRIALTIPIESGLGGTVGLRLVEVLDSYGNSEWPYHGISYVRWMSAEALGQFTSGNSASADNTDRLPIDMHEIMGLIAPRGLFIADNPHTNYPGLDRNSAWVTANVGKLIFEALGVGDHFSYQGASGDHCSPNFRYGAELQASIQKFLLDNASTDTGNFRTDLSNPPGHEGHIDWDAPTLSGEL
jgi:hypothetical protein